MKRAHVTPIGVPVQARQSGATPERSWAHAIDARVDSVRSNGTGGTAKQAVKVTSTRTPEPVVWTNPDNTRLLVTPQEHSALIRRVKIAAAQGRTLRLYAYRVGHELQTSAM